MVPRVKEINAIHISTPLERFVGEGFQVLSTVPFPINSFIRAEYLDIAFPENSLPEEHGRLYLFPVDDKQFSVQILYLQHLEDADMAQICWLHFSPSFFHQYALEALMANIPFRFDKTTEQQFSICTQTQSLLQQLEQAKAISGFLQSLQQSELAIHLLRRALENILMPFTVCQVPACRFLAYDSEREKIAEARRILEKQFDTPISIKELSRKVAMNECYLKKGFKAITGKTIHEYQQNLRISKAKELLSQQGYSVSNVAAMLGFSSISHFSTAFKKATGMKPCELLG